MSAPVRHTCPDIDKAIKAINDARKCIQDATDSVDNDDKNESLKYADDYLWGLDTMLEDLRSSNDALRQWGHDLEKEIIEKDYRIDDLETQVSDLDSAIGNANL